MLPYGTSLDVHETSALNPRSPTSCDLVAIADLDRTFRSSKLYKQITPRKLVSRYASCRCVGRDINPGIAASKQKGELNMLITKKMLIVLTLVGALVGAGIGSLITHSAASTASNKAANTSYDTTANTAEKTPDQIAAENGAQFKTTQEQTAYRQGFDEGFSTCTTAANTQSRTVTYPATYRAPVRRYSNSRRAYYDYGNQPRGRTFWQKHRDKLTLAIGTGAGAAVGGLIGGKKGAGIGSLAGLGSSALYTYKIRKRAPRY
jgi:hypothetical protein